MTNVMPTLSKSGNELASSEEQLRILSQPLPDGKILPSFEQRLSSIGLDPFKPTKIGIFQMNLGKLCNQTCKHCHVDAGPDRTEVMSKHTMQECLDALDRSDIPTVDITGGAPEINPDFRWLVEQLRMRNKHIMVRCNLTVIMSGLKYRDLPSFFAENQVEVICSLPFYTEGRTDRQRGDGVFQKSMDALKDLNRMGYAQPDSDLKLNLVYNPAGAFLPGNQSDLQSEFKRELENQHGVQFNELYTITNMPISRYLEFLIRSGNYAEYMTRLVEAFNPSAATGVMCRDTISIGWDGTLYDCDFNQMLDMRIEDQYTGHVRDFDQNLLESRTIRTHQHCYGCTAGAGSSCGGAVSE